MSEDGKMPEWMKTAATLLTAVGLGGTGAVSGVQQLDLFGVQQLERHLAACQEDNAQDALRADERLTVTAAVCQDQMKALVSSVNSLRGQNCEMQRANGTIREDANCWGKED